MAFDRSQFDRGQFDKSAGEKVRWLNADFSERVEKAFASALNYFLDISLYTRVDKGMMYGIPVRYIHETVLEEQILEVVTEAAMYALLHADFNEEIDETLIPSADVRQPDFTFSEVVSKSANIGADFCPTASISEEIDADTHLGADFYTVVENFELVSTSASSEAIEIKVCYLNITLQPGQRLIIDATNYNVLLDGENAIHTQSGDWIDALNRMTSSLEIDAQSGRGNIEASIMYTERFL